MAPHRYPFLLVERPAAGEGNEAAVEVGITANAAHLRATVEHSIGLVTALNPVIGYAASAEVAAEALATGRSVYDIVTERRLVEPAVLEQVLHPEGMLAPALTPAATSAATPAATSAVPPQREV